MLSVLPVQLQIAEHGKGRRKEKMSFSSFFVCYKIFLVEMLTFFIANGTETMNPIQLTPRKTR